MTFLIIDGTRHWPSIWHLFLKNIKVKGHQYPDYLFSKCIQDSWILLIIIADNIAVRPKKKILFPEIDLVKIFSSVTCPHSGMCTRIYIFHLKQKTKKARKQKAKKNLRRKENIWGKSNRIRWYRLRSSHWRCQVKKVFLKIFQISQKNTCFRVSF